MMEKGKRQQRRSEEDTAFHRMLLWLVGAVAVELLILLIKRAYVEMDFGVNVVLALNGFFRVFRFVGLVLTAAAAAWLAVSLRDKKAWLLPAVCTCVPAVLWVIALLSFNLFETGVRILMFLPAAAAALILIWFLYQRTFFVTALITGCGMAVLWLYRRYYIGHTVFIILCFVAGFVLLALAAALVRRLSRSGGKLGALRLMAEGTPYAVIYLTCAVTAAVMALTLILGAAVGAAAALYLLYVLVAWLFIQAVYFTVKLM